MTSICLLIAGIIVSLVPAELASMPATPQEALVKASKVVTYKTVDGVDLEMHVFLPEAPAERELRPGILLRIRHAILPSPRRRIRHGSQPNRSRWWIRWWPSCRGTEHHRRARRLRDDVSISAKANALILLYPAFDLLNGWAGGIAQCKKAGIDPKSFSPATRADTAFPPTLILVGNLDSVSPPASNTVFVERIKKAGVTDVRVP